MDGQHILKIIASVPGVKLQEPTKQTLCDEYAWMEQLPYPSDPKLCEAIISKMEEELITIPSTYMQYLYGVVEDAEAKQNSSFLNGGRRR